VRSNLGFTSGNFTGHYRVAAISGLTTGLAAGADVLSFRNSSTGYVRCALQRLRIMMNLVTPFTAGQEFSLSGFFARSFSADETGGTALTMTTTNATLNSVADQPSAATIRVASAGALTPGTYTLDAQPFIYCPAVQIAAIPTVINPFEEDYSVGSDQEWPFNMQSALLWQNTGNNVGPEGFIVRNNILQGAAGVVRMAFEIEWVEYNAQTAVGSVA
jgi:hypothetical protein